MSLREEANLHKSKKSVPLRNDIVDEIIRLSNSGVSIHDIRELMAQRGVQISVYKVWNTLKTIKTRHIYMQFLERSRNFDRVMCLLLFYPRKQYEDMGKLILMLDLSEFSIAHLSFHDSVKLNSILKIVDTVVHPLSQNERIFMYVSRVPPLSPTRSNENKFTKYLRRHNIQYAWMEREVYKNFRKYLEGFAQYSYVYPEHTVEKILRQKLEEKLFKERNRFRRWLQLEGL